MVWIPFLRWVLWSILLGNIESRFNCYAFLSITFHVKRSWEWPVKCSLNSSYWSHGLRCGTLARGSMERWCAPFVILWSMHSKSEQRDYRFRASVSSVLSSHTGLCIPLFSPIKQRAAVCSGFLFPSTLSLHPVTPPSSAAGPEALATSVDPFPLNDTPPPLPAKKHRRQQQLEQQVTRKVDRPFL